MRFTSLAPMLMGLTLAVTATAALAAAPFIDAAIADKARPPEDTARDALRKPADMLTFAGIKPGDTVVELLPGGGYFTRVFSKAIGPKGVLYAVVPPGTPKEGDTQITPVTKLAALPDYPNIKITSMGPAMAPAASADVFWTSQNYHDLYLTRVQAQMNIAAFDKWMFATLKPGGVLIVVDHVANAGSPVTPTADALHRIDPAAARKDLEAAGFVYVGESKVLANPADDHSKNVFDPAIRAKTDQFVYKFRRP